MARLGTQGFRAREGRVILGFASSGGHVSLDGVGGLAKPGQWSVDGKFFRRGGSRVFMKAITYGPFPGGWPVNRGDDFKRIRDTGANAIRLYEMPDRRLLDAAAEAGLSVFAGLKWKQGSAFLSDTAAMAEARVVLEAGLKAHAAHPAFVGLYVGNEVPADLVRWMGPVRVREALEELIALARSVAPELLFAYANYPSTEYLEPENADFTAFNVYLEDRESFEAYVGRLHHIAGDRPLVISEFGLDSRRNGLARQAETLRWGMEVAQFAEAAGATVYAWSDRWWNAGAEVTDWDFGLVDREERAKPALAAVTAAFGKKDDETEGPEVSVIVCTRNGRERIGGCLRALAEAKGNFETVVVDDGSIDGTADWVEEHFPEARLLRLPPVGLSAARNAGAAAAKGEVLAFTDDDCEPDEEWVMKLRGAFKRAAFAALGGPNLPPPPRDWREAVIAAAPGAPSHVMIDDVEAEHLPGCNLAVRRPAFEAIGGFDPRFRTAGDDVDFCWRLHDAGFRLGFVPGAFVWHWRRPSLRTFFKQQIGYGRAEKLLWEKHPQRFSQKGDARWRGFVYGGGPVRAVRDSVIYFGEMGMAGYQAVSDRMLPLRGLPARFDTWCSRLWLKALHEIQPRLRAWVRGGVIYGWPFAAEAREDTDVREFSVAGGKAAEREMFLEALLAEGWRAGGEADRWDVEKEGARLLLAMERGEEPGTRLLVRAWGEESVAGDAERLLRTIAEGTK